MGKRALFTPNQVATHNSAKSLWLIINGKVYDVTSYHKRHPGGAAAMLQYAGKDASLAVAKAHKTNAPNLIMEDFYIGHILQPKSARNEQEESTDSRMLESGADTPGSRPASSFMEESTEKHLPGDGYRFSNSQVSGSIDESRAGEIVSGEEALVATADLLYQQLRQDRRLIRFVLNSNLRQLASQLRLFLLSGAFPDEDSWPHMYVRAEALAGSVTDLADVLLDCLRRPQPLGEDPLVTAMQVTNSEFKDDERVVGYFDAVRDMVCSEPPPTDDGEDEDENFDDAGQEGRSEPPVSEPPVDLGGIEEVMNVMVDELENLTLPPEVIVEMQRAWKTFLEKCQSPEAAGEVIYTAIFEDAPSIQQLFTVPRAVQALRFVNSIATLMMVLNDPPQLRVQAETLGFAHMHVEVTVPRVMIFRDSIVDLLSLDLGADFTAEAMSGWKSLLSYIGGALIYVKDNYSDRVKLLQASWKSVNTQTEESDKKAEAGAIGASHDDQKGTHDDETKSHRHTKQAGWLRRKLLGRSRGAASDNENGGRGTPALPRSKTGDSLQTSIPTTFKDMFLFNAVVMGFTTGGWTQEVLNNFGSLVANVADTSRLQSECQILAVRISKVAPPGTVNLAEYKACMLASLRSLLPKEWTTAHDIAWCWLWTNVERLLEENMHNPPKYEKALNALWSGLDQEAQYEMRKQLYAGFFLAAPQGQDYFKQSNTRLHFIAHRVLMMTLELFKDPFNIVDEISATGLRHVGYGIPWELFSPYVTVAIEVVTSVAQGQTVAVEAFRWSIGLISKFMVRTICEGSTIVMKAINENSSAKLKKAISCAPRGERASWLLHVQVGNQHISPLNWAIESGSLDAARAIIEDLLTIRADRETYYYGMEEVFTAHPDLIKRLCMDAITLLPTLLDGLVWRSRITKNGMRRVNYYIKYLVVDAQGNVSDALKALVLSQDPGIVSHPVAVKVSDTLWFGIVRSQFILRKIWFIMSLAVFMLSQAILPNLRYDPGSDSEYTANMMMFVGRIISYVLGTGRLARIHGKMAWMEFRNGDTVKFFRIPIPRYLMDRYQMASFTLLGLLILMCTHEPTFRCASQDQVRWPTERCEESRDVEARYQVFSMCAMIVHWLLLVDLAVFSTGLSAFVLVCCEVLNEVSRFLVALSFLLLTFGSAVSCLRHEHQQFRDVPNTVLTLFAITVGRYEGDYRELDDEPVLLAAVFLFVLASAVLLLNLLIAQLNCSYEFVYQDMLGFARLNRASCIVETLETSSNLRWWRFVASLRLEDRLEFNEGDVGMAGGISTDELASLHPTVEECIHRFGGKCSPDMEWPQDKLTDQDEDQFRKMEKLIKKVTKKLTKKRDRGGGDFSGGSSSSFGASADLTSEDSGSNN